MAARDQAAEQGAFPILQTQAGLQLAAEDTGRGNVAGVGRSGLADLLAQLDVHPLTRMHHGLDIEQHAGLAVLHRLQDGAVATAAGQVCRGGLAGDDRHLGADIDTGRLAALHQDPRRGQDRHPAVPGEQVEHGLDLAGRGYALPDQTTGAGGTGEQTQRSLHTVDTDVLERPLHAVGEFIGQGDLGHGDLDHHLPGRLVQPRQHALDRTPALGLALEHDHIADRVDRGLAHGTGYRRNRAARGPAPRLGLGLATPRIGTGQTVASRARLSLGTGGAGPALPAGLGANQGLQYRQQGFHGGMPGRVHEHAATNAVLGRLIQTLRPFGDQVEHIVRLCEHDQRVGRGHRHQRHGSLARALRSTHAHTLHAEQFTQLARQQFRRHVHRIDAD